MICPHCRKAIDTKVSAETIRKARALRKQGYSFRDIEKLLLEKGIKASYITLSRRLRGEKP